MAGNDTGAAWERRVMCESALRENCLVRERIPTPDRHACCLVTVLTTLSRPSTYISKNIVINNKQYINECTLVQCILLLIANHLNISVVLKAIIKVPERRIIKYTVKSKLFIHQRK